MHIKDVSIKVNVCILGESKFYIYIYIYMKICENVSNTIKNNSELIYNKKYLTPEKSYPQKKVFNVFICH